MEFESTVVMRYPIDFFFHIQFILCTFDATLIYKHRDWACVFLSGVLADNTFSTRENNKRETMEEVLHDFQDLEAEKTLDT